MLDLRQTVLIRCLLLPLTIDVTTPRSSLLLSCSGCCRLPGLASLPSRLSLLQQDQQTGRPSTDWPLQPPTCHHRLENVSIRDTISPTVLMVIILVNFVYAFNYFLVPHWENCPWKNHCVGKPTYVCSEFLLMFSLRSRL